jgi:protease I
MFMSGELKGRKIAILATDGFEQVEPSDPKKNVEAAGAAASPTIFRHSAKN